MNTRQTDMRELASQTVERIEDLITECEATAKPLEVDPARSQLFELFVTAYQAGLVNEESDIDLTADGICHSLAQRWGLQHAAQQSVANQTRMESGDVAKMRSLWSVMRMWMEWTYAWQRWPEFHDTSSSEA